MADNPPELPQRVSPDGREIWDWAARLGNWTEREHNIRTLRADIAHLSSNRCGSCNDWMKSSQCPRERNVRGYSRGPSMNEAGCSKFTRKASTQSLIETRQSELDAMLAEREKRNG